MIRATGVPGSQGVSESTAPRSQRHQGIVSLVTRLIAVLLLLLALAIAVDRLSLWMWRWQVRSYCEHLRKACEAIDASGDSAAEGVVAYGRTRGRGRVPLLGIVLNGPRPRMIIVDGNAGLNLLYTPPYTAWTRHVPYLGASTATRLGPYVYPFNDVYTLRIWTVEDRPGGNDLPRPEIFLDHGLPS